MTNDRTSPGKTAPEQPAAKQAEAVHELRNALAGVRGAIQVVRDSLGEGMERDILAEVLQRVDDMDPMVRRLASAGDEADH